MTVAPAHKSVSTVKAICFAGTARYPRGPRTNMEDTPKTNFQAHYCMDGRFRFRPGRFGAGPEKRTGSKVRPAILLISY